MDLWWKGCKNYGDAMDRVSAARAEAVALAKAKTAHLHCTFDDAGGDEEDVSDDEEEVPAAALDAVTPLHFEPDDHGTSACL